MSSAWSPSELSADVQELFRRVEAHGHSALQVSRQLASRPAASDPAIVYLADRAFNGSASPQQIALHASVPALLAFVFNQLLRWPETLPWIGEPEREQSWGEFGRGIPLRLPRSSTLDNGITTLVTSSRPHDDDRAVAASTLAEVAAEFCMFHEIAHLVLGHAGIAVSKFNEGMLEFFTLRPANGRLLLRALECEADITAAYWLASTMLSQDNRQFFTGMFALSDDDQQYTTGLLYHWMFALHVLFLYLDQASGLGWWSAHPLPRVRSMYIAEAVLTQLIAEARIAVPPDRLNDALVVARAEAEEAIGRLGLAIKHTKPSRLERTIGGLEAHLRKVRPTYSPWSWFDSPPAEEDQGLPLYRARAPQ
jgi:hypothetical protein